MIQIGFGIDKSNDRYAKAVENGKQGGRPSTIDKDKIIYLHNQGLTNKEVAAEMNCSTSTVERAIRKYKKDNNFFSEDRQNRQNLNYNYNLNENDNSNVNSNDNSLNTGRNTDETVKTTTVNNDGLAAITLEEFYKLGETREGVLNADRTEAIFYDTGEVVKIKGDNKCA